ncbi:class I tRNA ligase family protein [Nakamurella aerolata]|uniref:Isoleucine--tRNA ligase n=1 Tax=Nakamurella aerolata TaxID=1656892 RepID=A0A849ADD8_9ACTN|nr:class I tRNA ligase family protein [Nakamurella aerolata]NNG37198.1 isoleucine--tRNA ligase [Nakamurella aerolata]
MVSPDHPESSAATQRTVPAAQNPSGQSEPAAVSAHPDFPALERQVLDFWDADGTFQASIDQRPAGKNGDNEFVFYDGPPFANGLPHYGHLLTGYVKDVVPRYQTMRGKRVERRFGWDTHGLPAELEAMDQLGIKTKDEILQLGIGAFNDACRASVLKYTKEWRDYVTRQARWVDFDHDYKTLNPEYMESVIWAFKKLYDSGLIYEGFRVLPYCWNDQTPLSNHELRMDDDVYQMRQDPAVTVGFRLHGKASDTASGAGTDDPLDGAHALIWTTTPWTLTANLAVMVHPDVDYLVVESSKPTGTPERYVIAEARVGAYARELGELVETGPAENSAAADSADPSADGADTTAGTDSAAGAEGARVLLRLKGSELLDRQYTPPMSYYAGHPQAHRVVAADFVTTTDGTGLVHSAGAFGEEDKVVTDREGIEPVIPVGPDGAFRFPVVDYEGLLVFDANLEIIDHLKNATRGSGDSGAVNPGTVLLRRETYDHSYPHCWRCRQPLIYMAVSSWFVEVTKFKQRMEELNQQITWVPENVKDGQFGRWLENARDWSITRNRFWGSPVPVWKSDDPQYPRIDVYGSFAELERDFGTLPRRVDPETGEEKPDLHRPFIDRLTRPNPDDPTGNSTMRRVEDVLDVWFDSGSMSYAQVHYPFEHAQWFEHHFPADFIVEYIGQTRGWFYTLHVLATALFDRPAFKSVLCHGIVLGSDGQKMSKSLRNYPDVYEVFDRDGADAMRWFLMSSPILRGGNLVVTEEGIREAVRQAQLPLWNAWYFLNLYSGTSGHRGERRTDSAHVLDRYVLAKTAELRDQLTELMDGYDIAGACAAVRSYLEVLTNWYIRRSRERFWNDDTDAIDTLYTVLEVVSRLTAPLLPMVTESIWRPLTGGRSVHLTDWPAADELPHDAELVAAMDQVRAAASTALALRKANKLRVRQPLAALRVALTDPDALQPFSALLADEVNVREVRLDELRDDDAQVTRRLTVNARAAGPRLGKQVQQVIKAAKAGDWTVTAPTDSATTVSATTVSATGDAVGTEQVTVGGIDLQPGEYTLELVGAQSGTDGSTGAAAAAVGMLPGGGFLVLDTALTDQLRADGDVADLVRLVQQARKDAGLEVSDRITLTLDVPDALWQQVSERSEQVAADTLATAVERGSLAAGQGVLTGTVADAGAVKVGVATAIQPGAGATAAVQDQPSHQA